MASMVERKARSMAPDHEDIAVPERIAGLFQFRPETGRGTDRVIDKHLGATGAAQGIDLLVCGLSVGRNPRVADASF